MGFQELVNGKPEESVPQAAGAHVTAGGNAVGPLLTHDVHEDPPAPELAGADALDVQHQLFLVVEAGETLITIQCQLILVRDLPDRNRNRASRFRLNCKVGAGLAALEQEPVILQFRGANDPRPRAAPTHLLDIEIASVGNVVAFHFFDLPFRGAYPFYHRKPASAGSGASGRRPSSGSSAVAEGRVTGKAAGQDVSCGFKLIADETQAEELGAHGVFGVLVLLGLGAGRPHILRHLAQRQAKLNVAFELSCVDAASASFRGLIELEEPELDCPFGKGGVEVEHMVAAVVVMLVPAVACAVAGVPDVRKLCHRLGLSAVDLGEKVGVYRAAVAAHAAAVEL